MMLISYTNNNNWHIPPPPYIHRRGTTTSTSLHLSEFEKDYSKYTNTDDDETDAKSQFGTKSYWDAMYEGMGDFSSEEYSWYYGFEVIQPYLEKYTRPSDGNVASDNKAELNILIPGCGNDPLLSDMYNAGYRKLTGFDYSQGAIDRQFDLLNYLVQTSSGSDVSSVELRVEDARFLPQEWNERFDVIIEKGALDAIYLSGDGNFEKSVKELTRVLKRGGICISCSGVVPADLRREGFCMEDWEWLRDGTDDLKAGCFVLKKR